MRCICVEMSEQASKCSAFLLSALWLLSLLLLLLMARCMVDVIVPRKQTGRCAHARCVCWQSVPLARSSPSSSSTRRRRVVSLHVSVSVTTRLRAGPPLRLSTFHPSSPIASTSFSHIPPRLLASTSFSCPPALPHQCLPTSPPFLPLLPQES